MAEHDFAPVTGADADRGPGDGSGRITAVEAGVGPRRIDLGELWSRRDLLAALVLRDIRVRYKQTVLGAAWAVLQPLVTMGIFTLIFGHLAGLPSDGQPYALFVFSGLLAWNLFANGVAASSQSLVGSAALIGKVWFPRVIVPLASLGVGVVDFLVAGVVLVALMAFYGVAPGAGIVLLPLLVLGVLLLTLAVGLVLAALTVAYRDVRFVIGFALQIGLFLTPVVYATSLVPQRWQWLLWLNPMAGYVDGFRAALTGTPPVWGGLAVSMLFTAVLLAGALAYFQRAERRFADII